MKYVLGIDIGTGSTKAIAIGYNGHHLETAQHYYPIASKEPGFAEQNPELIFEAFKKSIADITIKHGSPAAISFSSAMHSVIPVDENGHALAGMIIWADARSQHIADRIRSSSEARQIYSATGTPIHAMSPLCKLIWLHENEPDLFQRTAKFISIKEYIWFKLFGVFEVDHSIASATGLFDIVALQWNTQACGLAGITANRLSHPVSTNCYRTDVRPAMARTLQVDPHMPFVIGASDGCCANLGSFVTAPGIAALTIGTSGAVRITGSQPVINEDAMIFNYVLAEGTYVSGGAVNNGGGAVKWLIKTFLNEEKPGDQEYQQFFSEAETVAAGSESLIFLPYLNGERAPLWNTRAGGVFFNIRQHHARPHFLRAGIEGVCFALFNVLRTLEQSSEPIKQIHISGGFINSPLWVQILADVAGKQLVIVQQEDASALGAIFLAVNALNLPETIKQPPVGEAVSIEPNAINHQMYLKRFEVFKTLYNQLKELMAADS